MTMMIIMEKTREMMKSWQRDWKWLRKERKKRDVETEIVIERGMKWKVSPGERRRRRGVEDRDRKVETSAIIIVYQDDGRHVRFAERQDEQGGQGQRRQRRRRRAAHLPREHLPREKVGSRQQRQLAQEAISDSGREDHTRQGAGKISKNCKQKM